MRGRAGIGLAMRLPANPVAFLALSLAGAAFALYWLSSFVLQARYRTTHFGADAHVYTLIAQGVYVDGLTRFHPVTMGLAAAWMKLLAPLTHWVSPVHLLKALFAAVGAAGVWAAARAFAAVVPLRYAAPLGIIYALSLSVWYFASIEESKIVTSALSALYIATYLQLRERWSAGGAVLLTLFLLLACLNEIVSGFLVIIPVVDTLVRKGVDWRSGRWVFAHALAGPAALLILEFVVNGWLIAPEHSDLRRASHLDMLISYVSGNEYSAATFMFFIREWLFFSIAAPSADATTGAAPWLNFAGTFAPSLAGYFASPVTASLAVLAGIVLAACVMPRAGSGIAVDARAVLLALMAYALLRAGFFFTMLPREPLLNSSAATLAHLLVIGLAFAASRFPAEGFLLTAFAFLLFLANGAFILGP